MFSNISNRNHRIFQKSSCHLNGINTTPKTPKNTISGNSYFHSFYFDFDLPSVTNKASAFRHEPRPLPSVTTKRITRCARCAPPQRSWLLTEGNGFDSWRKAKALFVTEGKSTSKYNNMKSMNSLNLNYFQRLNIYIYIYIHTYRYIYIHIYID